MASNINQIFVNYPSLFSLSHPIDEIRPVLFKTNDTSIAFFNEPDFKVIFTASNDDLILFYDYKHGIHFLCVLRKATTDEIDKVHQLNETIADSINNSTTHVRNHKDLLNNTGKNVSGAQRQNVSLLDKKSLYNISNTSYNSNK